MPYIFAALLRQSRPIDLCEALIVLGSGLFGYFAFSAWSILPRISPDLILVSVIVGSNVGNNFCIKASASFSG